MTDEPTSLSDEDILELVVSMTESRPALSTVRDAALSLQPMSLQPMSLQPESLQPQSVHYEGSVLPAPGVVDPGFTDRGVPTFDAVRERIEGRSGKAAGAAELDSESAAGAAEAERFAAREEAGKKRLDDIRKSMQQRP
ncbi:MAG: hypothetical protein WBA00_10565 [Rhodococcus sp. (in: high G+C Gram-positive bacteria)]